MELLRADAICYNNGSQDILVDADFRIIPGERYGLIGPNGAGKTTLIRLLLGEIEVDRGKLSLRKGLSIGYLPQKQEDFRGTIADFLLSRLAPIQERLTLLEATMSDSKEIAAAGKSLEELLGEYQEVQDSFERQGGYGALERGEAYLRRLGLGNPLEQEMESLSGGERSLVYFARALISEPELLILDEPGNHLDYLGLAWLEAFLANYQAAVLMVSHNRYLLDKTCRQLIAFQDGRLSCYTGSYSNYRVEVLRKAIQVKGEYEAGQKRIAALTKKVKQLQSIAMSQYNPPATVMSQLGAAKRKLAEEEAKLPEKPTIERSGISLSINSERSKSTTAIRVQGFSLSFDEKRLFENANMEIFCGERVALVGANGSGKSSLLKALLREGDWHHPQLKIGPSQKVGYLSQVPVFDRQALTIEDEVRSWGPLTKDDAFEIVNHFSFSYEDMRKELKVLSGGESNRLQLARFMYQKINLLILDEPTNHLDIISREAVEEALEEFDGTILVVSHDRFFLDSLVDRVYEIENRQLRSYEGNFSQYFSAKYPVLPKLKGKVHSRGKERSKDAKSDRNSRALELEKRITRSEAEKKEIEGELRRVFDSGNHQEAKSLSAKAEKLEALLEKLYAEWEELLG